MLRLLLTSLVVVGLIQGLFAQPNNVNLTSNSQFFDGEPLLKVNPNDPSNMVVAWMGIAAPSFSVTIKTKVTFDGGRSWSNMNTLPHFDNSFKSADPVMAWDSTGRLYLGYIDFKSETDSAVIPLFVSTDQGRSWQQVSEIWRGDEGNGKVPVDRPWLRVDNSGTNTQGTLYITTMPPSWVSKPKRPYLKVSTDQGQTWSNYRFIDTAGSSVGPFIGKPMAAPAVKANGNFVAAYPSYRLAQHPQPQFFLAESSNQGTSFSHTSFLSSVDFASNSDTSNYKQGYRLITHPDDASKLAFVYVGNTNGDNDVFVTHSEDGGSSWSQPVRVNDDPVGNGVGQDLVWASYSPGGEITVTWRDRRHGSGSGFFQPVDIYGAISQDNGATFGDNIRISDTTAAFDSVLLLSGNDFHANAIIEDTLYTVWGSKVSGSLDIYFARTQVDTATGTKITEVSSEKISWFKVEPNPADQQLRLRFLREVDQIDDLRLLIHNIRGQIIWEKHDIKNLQSITVNKWPDGIYQLSLWQGGKVLQTKTFVTD